MVYGEGGKLELFINAVGVGRHLLVEFEVRGPGRVDDSEEASVVD